MLLAGILTRSLSSGQRCILDGPRDFSAIMSDPSNSPQNDPSNRPNGEPPSFNWRLFILLGIASVLIGFALFGTPMGEGARDMTYAEFRKAWDQGRVELEDKEKPLQVVTGDTAYDAVISGWVKPKLEVPKGQNEEKSRSDFRVSVNLDIDGEKVQALLGESVPIVEMGAGQESPMEGTVETLTLADLRKALAMGEGPGRMRGIRCGF